jgi:hypothetical protein
MPTTEELMQQLSVIDDMPNTTTDGSDPTVKPVEAVLSLEDIRQYPNLQGLGALPGDRVVDGELVRVHSDGSLALDPNRTVLTEEIIAQYPNLQELAAKPGDYVSEGELVRTEDDDLKRSFMYGFDSEGNDIQNWGDVLEARFPLGRLSFSEGYLSPNEIYGEGFTNAPVEQRREMILNERARALIDEYGYEGVVRREEGGAELAGNLAKAIASPTTLLPIGNTTKAAAGISALLGAEYAVGSQLAQEGEINPVETAATAAISGVAGGAIVGGINYFTRRNANAIVRKAQEAYNTGVAEGRTGADLTRHVLDNTGVNMQQIDEAARLTNTRIRIPGSAVRAQEAIDRAITTDSATSRTFNKTLDKYLGAISTRVRNISEPAFQRLRRFEMRSHVNTSDNIVEVSPFLEGIHKLDKPLKNRIALHLFNQEYDAAQDVINKLAPELSDSFKIVKTTLSRLANDLKDAGSTMNLLDDYFPRMVEDLQGLRSSLGMPQRSYFEQQLDTYAKGIGKTTSELTEEQTAHVYDMAFRGYKVSLGKDGNVHFGYQGDPRIPGSGAYTKARQIPKLTEDQLRFYKSPEEALSLYIRKAVNEIEMRKMFGQDIVEEVPGRVNADSSVGRYVAREKLAGNIKGDEDLELAELLRARFVGGSQSPGDITQALRTLGYAGTIANPISAVTQLGDLGGSGAVNGLRNTLASAFGTKEMRLIDLGLDKVISEEMVNPKVSGQALEKLFKYSGFKAVDKLGKETLINASLRRARGLARTEKGRAKLRTAYGKAYGDEFDSLVDDLANGRVTENVKLYAFHELSDMQPVTLSEMPEGFNRMTNGRLLYMLKSFTLKQYDVVRRRVVQQWQRGNKVEAVKNMTLLGSYLGLANMGTGVIKDMLLGREVRPEQIPDRSLWALLGVYGMNKYTADRYIRNGQVTDAAVELVAPATPLIDTTLELGTDAIKGDIDENLLKYVKPVPIFGNIVYNWFGGGAEQFNENQ